VVPDFSLIKIHAYCQRRSPSLKRLFIRVLVCKNAASECDSLGKVGAPLDRDTPNYFFETKHQLCWAIVMCPWTARGARRFSPIPSWIWSKEFWA